MPTQQDYETAAMDILEDKVKDFGFDEILQCLDTSDNGELHNQLAEYLFGTNKGRDLVLAFVKDAFIENVKTDGLINAIHILAGEQDNFLNCTFEALFNSDGSHELLRDRAQVVYQTEIENKLGV